MTFSAHQKISGVLTPLWLTAASAVIVAAWAGLFHASVALSGYHAIVALVLHFAIWTTAVFLRFLTKRNGPALVFLAVAESAFALFYVLIFLSMTFWGDVMTLKIARTYFLSLPQFLASLPMPAWEALLLLLLPLLPAPLLIYFFRKTLSRQLSDCSGWLFAKTTAPLLAVLLLLATVSGVKAKRHLHQKGEPMLVFLFDKMWGWNNNPFFNVTKNMAGKRDALAFEKYILQPQQGNKKNVVLIVCDGLRADHLGCYGYARNTSPFLSELVKDKKAVLVRDVYASGAATVVGVPSLLLSRYWPGCSPYGFNLVKLLHHAGYGTHVLVSGAHREWYNIASFYLHDCDSYFDGKDSKQYYFKDDRVLTEGLQGIAANHSKPQFFYFHLQSPHETAFLRDTFAVFQPYKTITTAGKEVALRNAYDNKVLQADATISEILKTLQRRGILQNAVVMITADHGQGLGEHGVWGHVDWLYQPQVKIPLIVMDDSLSFYKNTEFARQIDVAATIADRVGLRIPETWQGRSLGLALPDAITAEMETGSSGLSTKRERKAVVYYSREKYVKHLFGGGEKDEWFDLRRNPEE